MSANLEVIFIINKCHKRVRFPIYLINQINVIQTEGAKDVTLILTTKMKIYLKFLSLNTRQNISFPYMLASLVYNPYVHAFHQV